MTMNLRTHRTGLAIAAAIAVLSLAAACDGGGGGNSFTPGGSVTMVRFLAGSNSLANASAEFYTDLVPGPDDVVTRNPFEQYSIDECHTSIIDDQSEVITYADVGNAVRLVGPSATMTLSRSISGGEVLYEAPTAQALNFPDGADYDISFDGNGPISAATYADGLHLPNDLIASSPDPTELFYTLPATGDVQFSWTPNPDFTEVLIILNDGDDIDEVDERFCRVTDDGDFAVPASVLAVIPTSGVMFIAGFQLGEQGFEGRDLQIVSIAARLWLYDSPP